MDKPKFKLSEKAAKKIEQKNILASAAIQAANSANENLNNYLDGLMEGLKLDSKEYGFSVVEMAFVPLEEKKVDAPKK